MNKEFWKALFIRTAKTWCQAFVGFVGVDYVGKTLADIDWMTALSVATVAAIVCFVWNFGAGLPEVKLTETLYAIDNDPDEEDEIEEVDIGVEDDEKGDE